MPSVPRDVDYNMYVLYYRYIFTFHNGYWINHLNLLWEDVLRHFNTHVLPCPASPIVCITSFVVHNNFIIVLLFPLGFANCIRIPARSACRGDQLHLSYLVVVVLLFFLYYKAVCALASDALPGARRSFVINDTV